MISFVPNSCEPIDLQGAPSFKWHQGLLTSPTPKPKRHPKRLQKTPKVARIGRTCLVAGSRITPSTSFTSLEVGSPFRSMLEALSRGLEMDEHL